MKIKWRICLDVVIILSVSLSLLLSAYNVIGCPYNLHKAINRIFDDHIQSYNERGDTLTIKAANVGWDGTEWSKGQAIKNGLQQIHKLKPIVQHYAPNIRKIHIIITYLGEIELERTLILNT
jgi:hypothetical protein